MNPTIVKILGTDSCTINNVTIMRDQLIKLHELRNHALNSISELKRIDSKESFDRAVGLGLQLVSATCDTVISVAGKVHPALKGLGLAYSALRPNAELLGKGIAGDAVTGADLLKGALAGANAYTKSKIGDNETLVILSDSTKVKGDLIINALANDEKAMVESMHAYHLNLRKWLSKIPPKSPAAPAVAVAAEIARTGIVYHEAYTAWKQSDGSTARQGVDDIQRKFVTKFSSQIAEIERYLSKCAGIVDTPSSPQVALMQNPAAGPAFRPGR